MIEDDAVLPCVIAATGCSLVSCVIPSDVCMTLGDTGVAPDDICVTLDDTWGDCCDDSIARLANVCVTPGDAGVTLGDAGGDVCMTLDVVCTNTSSL